MTMEAYSCIDIHGVTECLWDSHELRKDDNNKTTWSNCLIVKYSDYSGESEKNINFFSFAPLDQPSFCEKSINRGPNLLSFHWGQKLEVVQSYKLDDIWMTKVIVHVGYTEPVLRVEICLYSNKPLSLKETPVQAVGDHQ